MKVYQLLTIGAESEMNIFSVGVGLYSVHNFIPAKFFRIDQNMNLLFLF